MEGQSLQSQGPHNLQNEQRFMGRKLSLMVERMINAGLDLKVVEFLRRQNDLISEMQSLIGPEVESCRWGCL